MSNWKIRLLTIERRERESDCGGNNQLHTVSIIILRKRVSRIKESESRENIAQVDEENYFYNKKNNKNQNTCRA